MVVGAPGTKVRVMRREGRFRWGRAGGGVNAKDPACRTTGSSTHPYGHTAESMAVGKVRSRRVVLPPHLLRAYYHGSSDHRWKIAVFCVRDILQGKYRSPDPTEITDQGFTVPWMPKGQTLSDKILGGRLAGQWGEYVTLVG